MMNVNMSIHKDRALRSALLLTLLAIFFPLAGWGVTKQNADDAYTKGNYQQAIADYKELLKRGTSASLYYNLGNAYYRSDSLTQAILAMSAHRCSRQVMMIYASICSLHVRRPSTR